MTVRVITLKGPDAGLYYVEGLPSYYLDGDEPPGRWLGTAASSLGLTGELADSDFVALMAGLDPNGRVLGRAYGERSARGFDVTASAPKSVSVLFALGDDATRAAVLGAHDAAVGAMVGWIESHAHTRYRVNGQVIVVDAGGIAAAAFRQHTSRSLDPQLHTHVVIANRVLGPGGRWLALDARTLKCDQRTLSALYHAGLRSELTRTLGVRWQVPEHGIAEITDIPGGVCEEFSSRTRAVQARTQIKLDRFVETFGREPTPRQRWRLEREAVTDSRPSKAHGTDAESLHGEWAERSMALGHHPEQVVTNAIGRPSTTRQMDLFAEGLMKLNALDSLVEHQSSWRPAELVRELAAAVPTDVDLRADELVAWVDRVAAGVIVENLVELSAPIPPGVALRRDGRPVTEAAIDRALTTPGVLEQEEAILAWADRRIDAGGTPEPGVILRGPNLDGPQLDLAAAVAGDAALVLGVGPAGTGKTTALAPAVAELQAQGRAVFGVAPSAAAAEVLAGAGLLTDTLDKLLVEHRNDRGAQAPYDLPTGATVIVDEVSMVPTPRLAELAALADRRGWRVVLVGDPLQFSAVGRGGMFAHLVESTGAIELDRVRRFANAWERDASLRLRNGDVSVLDLYDDHGRLHGGTERSMKARVVQTWWAARSRGESTAMMALTNESVITLNRRAQLLRIAAGEIDHDGPHVVCRGQQIYVGDEVATRRNDREVRTDRGAMVRNRDRWEVQAIGVDGSLTLAGKSGTVTVGSEYARDHVELAYAQTAHGAQGRTVDRAYLLLDGPSDSRGVYVPMTRGRLSNEAFVVTEGEQTAVNVMAQALARDWIDRPALARRAELAAPPVRSRRQSIDRSAVDPPARDSPVLDLPALPRPARGREAGPPQATTPLDGLALRRLLETAHALNRAMARNGSAVDRALRELADATKRQAQVTSVIDEARRQLGHARLRVEELDRPLRRHRNRQDLGMWSQAADRAQESLNDGHAELTELSGRIPVLKQNLAQAKSHRQDQQTKLEAERLAIGGRLRDDRTVRGEGLGLDPPDHLVRGLGPRPDHGPAATRWDVVAALVDQHRRAFGITDTHRLLGPEAGWQDNAYDASYRVAVAACKQLGRDLGRRLEIEPPSLGHGLSL